MPIQLIMNFSTNLKKYLDENNLTLKELAAKLDVPMSTAHGWLNGTPPKNILTIKKIANFMDCSIEELFFDEELISPHVESNLVLTLGKDSYKIILKKLEK